MYYIVYYTFLYCQKISKCCFEHLVHKVKTEREEERVCVCVCMRAVCTWEITQGLLWFGSESLLTINVFSINDFQNPQISLNISCPWSQITMKSSTFIHFSFLHYCYTLNIHDLIVAAQVWKSASFNYDHLTFMQTWRICLNLQSSGSILFYFSDK